MKVEKELGFVMFIGGIVLLMAYGIILDFTIIVESVDVIAGLLFLMIVAGFFILLISIIKEQRAKGDENLKDISEEDLKP